jgi:selenide,water dikinase
VGGGDDAGVFRVSDDLALVQTADFFTPIVDDAADWGRIAASNALSDVYAMGGRPLTAVQLVGWPRDDLPFELLGETLIGAAEVLAAAGCTIVGGHSIDDREPKFGLAVTGLVHPDRIVTATGAEPGDVLVLTKPIGTGLVATGIKRGTANPDAAATAVAVMTALNDGACRAMLAAQATAATDVTGFGLLGHLGEMLGGRVGAVIDADAVPLLPEAADLAAAGVVPGGTRRNLEHAATFTDFGALAEHRRLLLADAQTSGGLLIAVPSDRVGRLLTALDAEGAPAAAVVGSIVAEHPGRVAVETP